MPKSVWVVLLCFSDHSFADCRVMDRAADVFDLFVPCVVVLEKDVGECSSVEELLHVGEENPLASS